MKKICFITTVHGTLRSFLLPFAEHLHQRTDWQIHFICNPNEEFAQMLPDYIHYHPIPMKRGTSLDALSVIPVMAKLFKEEKFDLIQYSTPNAAFYASIAGRLAKVPVRLYCQWGMVYVSMKGPKKWLFRNVERLVCANSTHIEPDSFGNLDFARQQRLYPSWKGTVVWNGSTGGINLDTYDLSCRPQWRQEIRTQYQIPEDAVVFSFVGRINGDKGINELFTAFRNICDKMPDARLLMVGNLEKTKTLNPELLQWAQSHPQVIFTGRQKGVQRFYAAMDVFVLPSYREGFGSVVIEAEAMEVPVIATDIPGPREAMCRDVTGLMVPKQDAEALAKAMLRLYGDQALRLRLGKAGRQYVAERFEQHTFHQRTMEDRAHLMNLPEERKKLCIVTTVHGTLRSFHLDFAKYLHQQGGYDISFVCNPDPEFRKALPHYIHYYSMPMKRGVRLTGLLTIGRLRRLFKREKFDYVQYSTPNASFYASIAAKQAKIPHRKYHLMGFRYLSLRGLAKPLFRWIERDTCRRSTDVECVSPSNLELGIQEKIFPRGGARVIHYGSSGGINLNRYDISKREQWRQELREKYGLTEADRVFGYAGRITRDKGINEMLQAFFGLGCPHKKLVLIGNLEQERTLDAALLQQARQDPNVIFIPKVLDIERYYTMMDVLLLPSYREGFGNIIIEAQAMAVPVIVSEIPGPVDAMERDVTGLLVPPKDANALHLAMEKLGNDVELSRQMGLAGRRLVEERFDQQVLFAHILKDRQRILSNERE